MGKKLRNREIQNPCSNTHNKEKTSQSTTSLPTNQFKKIIQKKFKGDSQNTLKIKKFQEAVKLGAISSLIDQTKLECPICLELMVQPTRMICGHMYCFRCLESNTAHSRRCCLCRKEQEDEPYQPAYLAQTLINNFLLPKSNEVIKYLCRTTDSSQWTKRRYLSMVRPGMIVDFQDSLNMWRKAIIVKTFISNDQKFMATIKMNIKGSDILENVETNSKRLAPARFFTKGRYLQEYSPSLPEHHYHDHQLYNLQYRIGRLEEEFSFLGRQQDETQERQSDSEDAQQNEEEPVPHYSPVSENMLDQALVLFNLEMIENQILLL